MFYLKTDRLRVEVCEPHEAPNTTFRFDRAGFVSEVTLDGRYKFCATEPNNLSHPSSGGMGFCSEIQCDVSSEAGIGEYFPKFGIGLLKKEEHEPYCFFKKYTAKLFPIEVKASDSAVEFITEPIVCRGYALKQHKVVSVKDNTITFLTKIKNVGEKSVHIKEYCHNFISICGMAIGESYQLELPNIKEIARGLLESTLGINNYRGTEYGLQIAGYSKEHASFIITEDKIECQDVFCWKMVNTAAKAYISCQEFFVPSGLYIWCVDHMLSPEVFCEFDLNPGDTREWKRKYSFEHM